MTARQFITQTLKSIDEFNGRVYFIDRPSKSAYPCVVYNQVGVDDLDLINKVGVAYSRNFSIDVRAKTSRECEELSNKLHGILQSSPRLLDRQTLYYSFDDADSSAGSVKDPFGVYRGISFYTIKER